MWWEGGCDVIFNITEGGFRTNFFCFGEGVLSKFLLYNSCFSAPPPSDNYCTVPKLGKGNLFSVGQVFVGRDEIRAPLKTPALEASIRYWHV